jgi:hypothetical protein
MNKLWREANANSTEICFWYNAASKNWGIESERDARDKHKRREEKIEEKNKWNAPERSRT